MARTPEQQESRRLMMANDPIPKVIFKMAIPTIVAFLINSIYSLADTYFVSGLGKEATAAVTVNASLDQLIMMAGSMLAVGANSYIARLLGQGNTKKANQVLSTAFFSAFALGALVMIFGNVFMTGMVRLLGATPTCEQYSIDYATYVLFAAPFMATSFVMNQCLRSEGSATLSMIGMGFGGILNCVLDPILILGTEGLKKEYGISLPFDIPAMKVAGASLATAISKWVSFGILIFPYIFRRSMLRLSVRYIRFNKDIVGQIVAVGSSSMFRSGLAVVAGILLNQLAGEISDSVLGGMGVATKIMMFPFSIILGFGTGFQPVAGFNWGAKKYDRVIKSYRFSSLVAIIGGVVMGVGIAVFVEPLIIAFAGSDTEMLEFGKLCTLLQCIALPIHAWVAVVNMLCAGLGNAWGALALSTARQGSCMIPILYPLAYLLEDVGIASVQALADVLTLVIAIPIIIYMLKKIRTARDLQASA
ncbi:MAG: MATE family efflux transporter [Ruminococcaceae bacterium]|nr:MATE family efflux transporter [Oscillospiraceae bacterium]